MAAVCEIADDCDESHKPLIVTVHITQICACNVIQQPLPRRQEHGNEQNISLLLHKHARNTLPQPCRKHEVATANVWWMCTTVQTQIHMKRGSGSTHATPTNARGMHKRILLLLLQRMHQAAFRTHPWPPQPFTNAVFHWCTFKVYCFV